MREREKWIILFFRVSRSPRFLISRCAHELLRSTWRGYSPMYSVKKSRATYPIYRKIVQDFRFEYVLSPPAHDSTCDISEKGIRGKKTKTCC